MNSNVIDIIINSVIFLVFLFVSIVFIARTKFESKGYKYMFITYILFWIPIMLVREYRGKVQGLIDPNFVWIVLAAYGFIGIFFRIFSDYFSLRTNSRKLILIISTSIILVTFIIFIFYTNTATNVIQSIGIGVGASMIGIYELMFKEQYTKNKSYLTVSILAIPPLLADFITSPIQSLTTILAKQSTTEIDFYKILWIISIFFIIITIVMIIFLKEDRKKILPLVRINVLETNIENKKISKNSIILSFIFVSLLGSIIAFIKFSNSGAVAITTIETLANNSNINVSNFQAYISLIFSVFQLIGSISIYLIAKKNKGVILTFTIGSLIWFIYHILISFIQNPIVYFSLSALNGMGYGILYNSLLAYILSISFKTKKITPMGIYQSILSIGITSSSFFVSFLKKEIDSNSRIFLINITLGIICIFSLFFFLFLYKKYFPKSINDIKKYKNKIL